MVLREKKISNKSDNVQLQVSFGLPDIKALLRFYVSYMCELIDGDEAFLKTLQLTEQDMRNFFEQEGRAFQSYPDKWREQLSSWAFAVAVRNRLLIPAAAHENMYYLADCLFVKRGRPPQND